MPVLRESYKNSAWSANLYLDTPSLWVYRQIFQRWGADSARASMGRAVEAMIESACVHGRIAELFEIFDMQVHAKAWAMANMHALAHETWDNLTGGLAEPERDYVWPIAENMLCELAAVEDELGAFRVAQARSGMDDPRLFLDGLNIPCRYTVDLSFDNADVDLKATLRLPSKPHHPHMRQMGLYKRLRGGKSQWLLYATPKKSVLFKLESEEDNAALEAAADEAVAAFRAIETLNDTFDNPHDVTRIIPLNSDAWQWGEGEIEEARKLWTGEN